jgi:RNA polymerase sigma factor (sigma-70 family)
MHALRRQEAVVAGDGIRLVDEQGAPLDPRVGRVLEQMRGRLRRQFPECRDELIAVDVLEEAGRRLLRRERRSGPIANLHGYAWVTIRSVMTSRLRRGDARLRARTIRARNFDALPLAQLPRRHSAAELERRVLLGQVLALLTADERQVCRMKAAGYSTGEIARHVGRSHGSVDTCYSRAKAKARRLTHGKPRQPTFDRKEVDMKPTAATPCRPAPSPPSGCENCVPGPVRPRAD